MAQRENIINEFYGNYSDTFSSRIYRYRLSKSSKSSNIPTDINLDILKNKNNYFNENRWIPIIEDVYELGLR